MATRAVVLAIQRQPGANTVEVVDNIKKLLPQFRAAIPASVSLDVLIDRSLTIRKSVSDVEHTYSSPSSWSSWSSLFFCGTCQPPSSPALALPMSIIGTFAAMALLGYSLDNLSLMALTLCVGFVVG